jgi:hypothetical protein
MRKFITLLIALFVKRMARVKRARAPGAGKDVGIRPNLPVRPTAESANAVNSMNSAFPGLPEPLTIAATRRRRLLAPK